MTTDEFVNMLIVYFQSKADFSKDLQNSVGGTRTKLRLRHQRTTLNQVAADIKRMWDENRTEVNDVSTH